MLMSSNPYLQMHVGMCSHNWNSNVVTGTILADKYLSRDKESCIKACTGVLHQLKYVTGTADRSSDIVLDYIGNSALLSAEKKVSLICHRIDELFFNQQMEAVLNAARSGSVVVSAFVSKKENEIKNRLMNESLPIIEIMSNGFALHYLPFRSCYDACAAGRYVQISPWDYNVDSERRLTREMCLVMNQLVRVISKTEDDWWRPSENNTILT